MYFERTDAAPGASTERNERVEMSVSRVFRKEVIRVEFVRVLVDVGLSVKLVGSNDD